MRGRVFGLIAKEFLTVAKDKRSRAVLVVLPLLMLVVFPRAATFDVRNVRLAVFNEDAGSAGRELAARFASAGVFLPPQTLTHNEQIQRVIEGGQADLVVHIGENFSRYLVQQREVPVQLIVDGRNSNTALVILSYAGEIIGRFNQEVSLRSTPSLLVERAWFNPNLFSLWSIMPGLLAIITLVASVSVAGFSVAREKEAGTFSQLLVTPLRPVEIVVGKIVPAMAIGLVEGAIILLASVFGYGVPLRGSLLILYAGLILFLLSTIGVGLMISSLSRTQQQALLGALFFIAPTVILSGWATPIANMPTPIQYLTLLNPMRYFLVIARSIFLKDWPFSLVWPQLWPMALIAAVSLFAAACLFRTRLH